MQLHLLLTAFPALKYLDLSYINIRSKKPPPRLTDGRPLLSLKLRYTDNVVAAWLGRNDFLRGLKNLYCDNEEQWEPLSETMDSSLQDLALRVPHLPGMYICVTGQSDISL